MVVIPEEFTAGIVNLAGAAGQTWTSQLPGLVESLCRRWHLTVDGEPMHGYLGLVVPVSRVSERCVLKVSWPDDSTLYERSALLAWNGHGAVRVLESDPALGAMVLERVNGRRSLGDVEIGEAVTTAGRLMRRLSVPAPRDLPRLTVVAEQLSRTFLGRWEGQNRPLPRRFVDAARDLAARRGPAAGDWVVNYDLHYDNVLAGEREPWLVIDPKVVAGDPEYGIAQLLWTRLDDMTRAGGLAHNFHLLVAEAGLDLQLTMDWTLVRVVDYWLWAWSVGLTEDPMRCEAIAVWLDR
jgi:streptomycin 6-kinase